MSAVWVKEFAGTLRERVTLWTPTAGRDALGAEGEDWTLKELVWASVEIERIGPGVVAEAASALRRFRVTMRPCAVAVGDRIERASGAIEVREVIDDPRFRDRIVAIGEERR